MQEKRKDREPETRVEEPTPKTSPESKDPKPPGMPRWRCQGYHVHLVDNKRDKTSAPAVVEAPDEEGAARAYEYHGHLTAPDRDVDVSPANEEDLSKSQHRSPDEPRARSQRKTFVANPPLCKWAPVIAIQPKGV